MNWLRAEPQARPWWVVPICVALVLAVVDGSTSRASAPGAIATITKRIVLPGKGNVVAAGGAVWATDAKGTLAKIDPATNRVVARIPLAARSPQLCCGAGFGALWLADTETDTVLRVGIRQNTVVARIPVGRSPVGTAVGFGSVWVANNRAGSVMRIDPETNRVDATISVGKSGTGAHYGNGPLGLAVARESVWATVPNAGRVVRIDPRSNRVTATLGAKGRCTLAARAGSVWAAGACGHTRISRIDARSGRVTATHDLGDVPGPPAVLGRYVWTVMFSHNLARLDARTLEPAGRMRLRGLNTDGEALAAGHGALWVRAEGFVVRMAPR